MQFDSDGAKSLVFLSGLGILTICYWLDDRKRIKEEEQRIVNGIKETKERLESLQARMKMTETIWRANKDEIRIRNRVVWKAEDGPIQAQVIMLDFTCVYDVTKNVTASSGLTEKPLQIGSFKKEIEIVEGSSNFAVVISLFRDPRFQIPITADFGSLVRLAEGQVVYVSVDLREADVRKGEVNLVMKSCFVTSNSPRAKKSEQAPILYLLRDRCPVSPFVKVIANGEDESGKLSVRVFGWTGKDKRAENLYLHCTVDICQGKPEACKPKCESRSRRKRSSNDMISNEPKDGRHSRLLWRTDKPTPTVVVHAGVEEPLLSQKLNATSFDLEHTVSAGPITVDMEV